MKSHILRALAVAAMSAAAFALAAPALPASAGVAHAAGSVSPATTLTCHATMTNAHPRDFTSTGIKVRTVPFAHITTVAHYRTVNHPKFRRANADGRSTVWYYISGATPGFKVIVDVSVSRRNRHGSCATSFTPHS